ncbi:PAQR family membrane homeostasis protein TrhA [Bacillus massiliglaciei]|uniref:PAQR family membrane homeostasis protein TrhA n=1 Tax=Bacillus massiliglaciei TaxID=1816693 RepID=UPI000A73A9EE|nr:hemolysin III family protein [Bacillus massiliglaciei]
MQSYIREPINALTHFWGAVLSFVGLLALTIKASKLDGSSLTIGAVIIFGISMILLYSASALYHSAIASDRVIAFLRKVDHSMIFVLIAGSYTPFCLVSLNGTIGWTYFTIVLVLAVLGVAFKMIWFNCPRWLSTFLYIAMGWIIIFASAPLASVIGLKGLSLLILGGVFYTAGGIIYGLKPPYFQWGKWGFHEIFHIFIMLGTLSHFFCIYLYVL